MDKRVAVSEKPTPKATVEVFSDVESEDAKRKAAFDAAIRFAKQTMAPIWNVSDTSTKESAAYTRFTKEEILSYMQAPTANEKSLRNASIYMWDGSSQYRRLIQYYAGLLRWDYIISPLAFDKQKVKEEIFRKQCLKVQNQLDIMNLRHELQKAMLITLRDGVFYGAIWQNKTSFYVQRINPDFCSLTSIEDGTWRYSVDMSKILEKKLSLYPPEFTTMYNAYKSPGGNKWQEVPTEITFCIKADETTLNYSIPPWASTLPMLYDIETYKALQETASKISNYKLLGMQIPVADDGTPKVDWTLAEEYYRQLVSVLPPYVGAFVSPMKTESFEFERAKGTNDVDTVSRAEEQYWFNTGTSALLHGSNSSDTAGALKLSIRADEEIMFELMHQAERLINRILKSVSGTVHFKITFLPTTIYNQEDQIKLYKEAATLGIPGARSCYAATLGISQSSLSGLSYFEETMLEPETWTPLVSGYTSGGAQGSDGEPGRPAVDETNLDDAGAATRNSGANDNR